MGPNSGSLPRRRHGLHENAIDLRIGTIVLRALDDRREGLAYVRLADVERHAAGFSLVQDVGRLDLYGNWRADCGRSFCCLLDGLGEVLACRVADAVGRKYAACLELREHAPALRQHLVDVLVHRRCRAHGWRRGEKALAPLAVIGHGSHGARSIAHVREERIAGLGERLQRQRNGKRIAPHEDGLLRLAPQLNKGFALVRDVLAGAAAHDDDDAIHPARPA